MTEFTPEHAAFRASGITATDVAKAASGSYGGAFAVVAQKLDLLPPAEWNERMDRGSRWEETIADLVHIATRYYVVGEQTLCQHRLHGHHRATVDGFLAAMAEASFDDIEAVIESKTRGVEVRPNWPMWSCQVQWQLHTTGLTSALLAEAVIDDSDDTLVALKLHWIDRDEYEIERLVGIAEMLWSHIQAGTLPDPDTATALDSVKAVHATAASGAPSESASKADWVEFAASLGIDTDRLTKPRPLADGTWELPVPRKGALAELLATLDAAPSGKALVADQVDKDGKVVRAKRVTAKELGDAKAALASARDVLPEERKTVAVALEAEAVKEIP